MQDIRSRIALSYAMGLVIEAEGFRPRPYQDQGGVWHIGYGFNLEAGPPLPEEVADEWLKEILLTYAGILDHKIPQWRGWPATVQAVVLDMAYNLGPAGFLKFRRLIQAIDNLDALAAEQQVLKSRYAKQVPDRARRNAFLLRQAILAWCGKEMAVSLTTDGPGEEK